LQEFAIRLSVNFHNGGSKLIGQALAADEISVSMASLCGFEQGQRSKHKSWDGGVWFPAASA